MVTSDVKSFVGAPNDAGQLSAGVKDVVVSQPATPAPYFERRIPDADLPTEYVEGVLDIAN